MIKYLVKAAGIPGAPLLLAVISTYLVAWIYRISLLNDRNPSARMKLMRNVYFITTGYALLYVLYGRNTIHSFICTLFTWVICKYWKGFGPKLVTVGVMFYLIIGDYVTSTFQYDLDWTTPQMVLTLKLIGFALDNMDKGHLKSSQINQGPSDKKLGMRYPSLVEFFGFALFPCNHLVGPQFTLSRYTSFIDSTLFQGEKSDVKLASKTAVRYALNKFLLGILYMAAYVAFGNYFPKEYLLTRQFHDLPFAWRQLTVILTIKGILMRYLGIWLLSEGSNALIQISYKQDSAKKWDALGNVDPWKFETASSLSDLIRSFNIQTNLWVKRYIFERLADAKLPKRIASLASLIFLSVWHGLYVGYLCNFLIEFADMEAERRVQNWFKPLTAYVKEKRKDGFSFAILAHYCLQIVGYIWSTYHITFAMLMFEFKTWERGISLWKLMNFGSLWIVSVIVVLDILGIGKVWKLVFRSLKTAKE